MGALPLGSPLRCYAGQRRRLAWVVTGGRNGTSDLKPVCTAGSKGPCSRGALGHSGWWTSDQFLVTLIRALEIWPFLSKLWWYRICWVSDTCSVSPRPSWGVSQAPQQASSPRLRGNPGAPEHQLRASAEPWCFPLLPGLTLLHVEGIHRQAKEKVSQHFPKGYLCYMKEWMLGYIHIEVYHMTFDMKKLSNSFGRQLGGVPWILKRVPLATCETEIQTVLPFSW